MTNHSPSPSKQPDSSSTATIANLRAEAAAWLQNRKLDVELAVKLGWRSSKNTNGELEIPYYLEGREVNCKFRNLETKAFSQVKGGVKCFYNAQAIEDWQKSTDVLLICEGEMDCLVALQCGYLAVSVPDGAPSSQLDEGTSKYGYLDNFPNKGTVIICADGDAAGANLLHDLGLRLGKHRCKWIKYPQGCKDLNDALIKYGERGVKASIDTAQWLAVDGVYRMSELPPLPPQEGKPAEIIPINIRKADFSVWTGIPSHGKSTLLNFVAFNLAKVGWNIGFASFEQTPQTEHRYNLRTLALGMSPDHVSAEELGHADEWIDKRFSFIVPDVDSDEETNLGWLLEKMAASVVRHEIDMIIIDPWNELEHDMGQAMTATQYTGWAVRQLKKFGRRYQIHVAVVAHPAKLRRDSKTQKFPVPALYDIADSAHWANKPDLGVIVHRVDGQTMIRVQKSRYHRTIGKPDDYYADYDDETKRYSKPGATYSYGE